MIHCIPVYFISGGIFEVTSNYLGGDDACAEVLSITIVGTAIPLCLVIIGLMFILCCVAVRNCRRRRKYVLSFCIYIGYCDAS